jgi:hypothetical protein
MGWPVKIGFPCYILVVRQARGHTSIESRRAVHLVTRPYVCSEVFKENLIFSTCPPILQTTSKPIKWLPLIS